MGQVVRKQRVVLVPKGKPVRGVLIMLGGRGLDISVVALVCLDQ